jgi:uncharacterized protein YxjI
LFIASSSKLFVQQRKEWAEILIDWETANKYAVLDEQKRQIGYIAERSDGFWTHVKRWFLRSHRGFRIEVLGPAGERVLTLTRAFFWFFSDLLVLGPEGARHGEVRRRFGILRRKYDLVDETGRTFARIASPIWRIWTFAVRDESGTERAVISKKWGGALTEIFTDADTYMVDFGDHPWSEGQRAVIFAAAISVDFDFFENNQGRGGLLNSFSA